MFICIYPWRKLFLIQHFREVNCFKFTTLSRKQSLDVHQAARIAGDDIFCAGLGGGGAFHFAHRGGNHREFRGEGSAEAAAGFLFHLDKFQSADFAKQRARRGFDAEFTQAVTAVVERDLVREFCAEIGDAKFADEEIGKLPRPRGDFFCKFSLWRFGEKLGIKVFHHRAAGAGTDNDDLGVRQFFQHRRGNRARLGVIAGVERRLAAAGDCLRADDRVAETFENFDHADARARKQRVHKTRNEQRDDHAWQIDGKFKPVFLT